ncbi:MAG: rclA, partial [Gammaproteobacteria bacterium]|nr:rclA [Gammaproteobacteria bacterium]
VRQHKRAMVDGLIATHRERYEASGTELILGEARFIAPQTLEVTLQNGSVRVLVGERVVILVPFLLLVAWAAYAFWDEPIRTRLKARLLGRH